MSDIDEFLALYRDVFRLERKEVAARLGVSTAQYSRIEAGRSPVSMGRLKTLGEATDVSLAMLLLAFLLMDKNVAALGKDDPGARIVHWLHQQLAAEARAQETNSAARHFLGTPQSLERILRQLNEAQRLALRASPPALRSADDAA